MEVELDILTGTFLIRRVDAIEDCGQTMSPYVDLGQVEGALSLSMGLHTCEELKYDPVTGQKITAGTWVMCLLRFFVAIGQTDVLLVTVIYNVHLIQL